MSINKLITVGRLTADPQQAERGGAACCTFTVASDSTARDGDGKPIPVFYRVTAWRKLGELCANRLRKGDPVAVIGDLAIRPYKDRNGQDRTSVDQNMSNIEFLSSGRKGDAASSPPDPGEDELPI